MSPLPSFDLANPYRSTGEKDKSCPDCKFNTVDPASLLRHRRRKHGYVPQTRRQHSRTVSPATSNSVTYPTPSPECVPLASCVDGPTLPHNNQVLQYPSPATQLTEQDLASLLEASWSQTDKWQSQPSYPATVCAPIGGDYHQHFVLNNPVAPTEQPFDNQFRNSDHQDINPFEQSLPISCEDFEALLLQSFGLSQDNL